MMYKRDSTGAGPEPTIGTALVVLLGHCTGVARVLRLMGQTSKASNHLPHFHRIYATNFCRLCKKKII